MITVYFNLDDDGYIDCWGSTPSNTENEHSVELPKDHEFFTSDMHAWKYENDTITLDEERQQELDEEHEKEKGKLTKEEINEMAILELASIVANMIGDD